MRVLHIGLVLALLGLSCQAAWCIQITWKGFVFENQPFPPYVCASSYVESGQLWQVLSNVGKYTGMPANPAGEKIAAAKLVGGDGWLIPNPITYVKARVFDPVYNTNSGWVLWVKDNTGKWLGVGRRTLDGTGYVRLWEHDGSAWTYQNLCQRGTDGNNYFTSQINFVGGTAYVTLDYQCAWGSGTVYKTSTLTYGDVSEIYLYASTKDTDYKTYKWLDFAVPEPGSVTALLGGLSFLAFAIRRKK